MRLLAFMFRPILCLMLIGCTETPAEKDQTGMHPEAHLSRGGPRNRYGFVVSPDVLKKWIREIPEVTKGIPADEVIGRLGEPDEDYADFIKGNFFSPVTGRTLVYDVAVYRFGDAGDYNEEIHMEFDPNNRYMSYWVKTPFHPSGFPDEDLSALISKWPVASVFPPAGAPGD
jgi:hypothetical protein